MENFSTYVFVAVIMSAVGFITARVRNFNIWKMVLIGFIAAPIVMSIANPGTIAWIAVISFFVGYLLPHAHILYDFSDTISDVINSVRYRDDRQHINSQKEELRRKEEELRRREEALDQLRRQYEEAMRNARQSQSKSDEQTKSKTSSGDKQKKQQDSRAGSKNKSSRSKSKKEMYLEILGLDPSKQHSKSEIAKKYRELAQKYHPDMHHGKPAEEIKKLTKEMQRINEANEWLKKNPDD